MRFGYIAGTLTVAAALALPASALAHGSVYTSTALIVDGAPPPTQAGLTDQVRHVVTNHGFTFVLRESNGASDHGMLNYAVLPGAYRNQPGYEPGAPGTRTRLLAEGDTAAQPHATCRGVAELDDEAAILAWQGSDPFYNYVPFQKAGAGLEDDPATWIAVVKERTGVDLATADPGTACETTLGGTFVPADAILTSAASLASGTVEQETAPLTTQIATLTQSLTDANAARTALQGLLDAARGEIAKLVAAAAPMKVALPSARIGGKSLANRGTTVTVTGPAGAPVRVALAVSERRARKLRLPSSVLASAKGRLGADGTVKLDLTAKKAARKALRKLERSIGMTATARAGDRIASSGATIGG